MATVRQYINLEPKTGEPRLSRAVRFKTTIDTKKARRVHAFLEAEKTNISEKKLAGSRRGGIDAPGSKHAALLTEDDGSLALSIVLSTHGGDKFRVDVSRDRKGKKKIAGADLYEVWRKLYYQVTRMKPTFTFPFGKIKSEYERHFVELEETSTESCPHKENVETAQLKAYGSHFKKKNVPFEVHVVLIDRQCDSTTHYVSTAVSKAKTFFEDEQDDWPFADWIVKADSKVSGGSWSSGAVTLTRATVGGKRGVLVDVSGTGIDPTKSPVQVDLEFKVLEGEYTGDATYKPNIFIAVGKPRSDESKSKTVAHEIGHGLGMVPTTGHNRQYSNENGGKGSHCRHGANPNEVSKAKGGKFAGVYTSGTCVMYASSSEHYKFCPTCTEHVLAAHLFKTDMEARGWG